MAGLIGQLEMDHKGNSIEQSNFLKNYEWTAYHVGTYMNGGIPVIDRFYYIVKYYSPLVSKKSDHPIYWAKKSYTHLVDPE